MATVSREDVRTQLTEARYEIFKHWPVDWSAIVVGALAAIAVVIIVGLAALSLGMHLLGTGRTVDLDEIGAGALAVSIFGAFLAFAVGGWVAAKVAGIFHAEHAMLHGAIVWLAAIPLLVLLAASGSSSITQGWYAGIIARPSLASFEEPGQVAADGSSREVRTGNMADAEPAGDDAARAARNSALIAITALLLGLMGGVIGGWLACGEPISFTYQRSTRQAA
jgi:hypothetical protein